MMPPRFWRIFRRSLLAIVLLVLAFLVITPIGRYLLRAGWEEGKILARRRSIERMVADSTTAKPIADKLRLVLAARSFGAESVGLKAKQSFTTFTQLPTDTLVLVLSGAYQDQLKAKTWWFPIVGSVPYKGFFDVDQAKKAAKDLADQGFDVYLRPSPAFSTLGWFNDPLLSTSLRSDSIDLANTIIHELTHNTFYAPGRADFNESFANFVGARGASWFFRARGSTAAADEMDARWSDDKLMAGFWARLYKSVDSAFKAHPGDKSARLAARDTIYREARVILVHELGPKLRTIGPHVLERIRLDNGALLAHRVYLTDSDVFDRLWTQNGGNLPSTIKQIIELAKTDEKNPFNALRRAVGLPAMDTVKSGR